MEHECMHVAASACMNTVTAFWDCRSQFTCVCAVFLQVFTRQFHALVALDVTDQPLEVHKIAYHIHTECVACM